MMHFDKSEISQWADRPDSQHVFPELIRRLILATVPDSSFVDVPSGSSVNQGGWDGRLETKGRHLFVSGGVSRWEMSCRSDVTVKANSDYTKRTKKPLDVVPQNATYVFATPRNWTTKETWLKAQRTKGEWSDVQAIDANDLSQWLNQSPAVAAWFAQMTSKLPETGVLSLDQWWEDWFKLTNPPITSDLVLAGRKNEVNSLSSWVCSAPAQQYVKGNTRDESVAFVSAAAVAKWDQWGSSVFSRALVIQSVEAWRAIEVHPFPLILVKDFPDAVSLAVAIGNGHHVLVPLSMADAPRGTGIDLPQVDREGLQTALAGMGIPKPRARSLARSSARRIPILRRQLIDSAGGPPPAWAEPSQAQVLATVTLIGQWEDDNSEDRALVEKITGQSYSDVIRELTARARTSDPPIMKIGNKWRLVSHEEAWQLLAPLLIVDDLIRFKDGASDVFEAVSPKFDLPVEERFMAAVKGKTLPHSPTIRAGIARSLALMGSQPDRAGDAAYASDVPMLVVRKALEGGDDWRVWATLDSLLPILAEAAPEELLEGIERGIDSANMPFGSLFAQEGDPLFGGIVHSGVLWALERLAWSEDFFPRAAFALARLADIDPGGRYGNRPDASLAGMFLCWLRYSEVADDHRLKTLAALADSISRSGWRVLVGSGPQNHSGVVDRTQPMWRGWGQDCDQHPTHAEAATFLQAVIRLILDRTGADAGRWADVMEVLPNFSPEDRKDALEELAGKVELLLNSPEANRLWAEIRSVLNHHRNAPEAEWAMGDDDLAKLEAVYHRLTPLDLPAKYTWLFDHWPRLPEGGEGDEAYQDQITKAQDEAIRAVLRDHSEHVIADIGRIANAPFNLGLAVSRAVSDKKTALSLAIPHLGVEDIKLREMSRGILVGLFFDDPWPAMDDAVELAKASNPTPSAIADVFLAAPATRPTWEKLEEETSAVSNMYWGRVAHIPTRINQTSDLEYATEKLLEAKRSYVAAEHLWYGGSPELAVVIAKVLTQYPYDLAEAEKSGLHPRVDSYGLARLFEKLDKSNAISDQIIAKIEMSLVRILRHDRPELALHRMVTADPATFAELISWAFKRSDDQQDGLEITETEKKNRAETAFSILSGINRVPGLQSDGTVDREDLFGWVEAATRLCKERGRQDIGDDQIGDILANAPVGADGVWPCEPVRDVLERIRSPKMGTGFAVGKRNQRGVTSRGLFDGGGQERNLSQKYRDDATKISATHPVTASLLRGIARSYEREARMNDEDASWTDQAED